MPQVIQRLGSLCCTCHIRFRWYLSKSGQCWWCETGKPDYAEAKPKPVKGLGKMQPNTLGSR